MTNEAAQRLDELKSNILINSKVIMATVSDQFVSTLRGLHAYLKDWRPQEGEELNLLPDPNSYDPRHTRW